MKEKLDIDEIIDELTIEEKVLLLSGNGPTTNNGIKRLNIESLCFNDGPHGLRKSKKEGNSLDGIVKSEKTTCFPTGNAIASSWNKDLYFKIGEAIAKECKYYGTDVLLGPSVNIKRNPLCGRNFEYLSEDPYLTGMMASSFINGVESHHVGTCVKHFACNNNENFRFCGDSEVDLIALNEIYLKPYYLILKNSKPSSFMCAYNMVNGVYSSENSGLLDTFLRKKNNFDGVIMTDWGAIVDRVNSLKAGLDLEMPGCSKYNISRLVKEAKENKEVANLLDTSVRRLLNLYNKVAVNEEVDESVFLENYKLSVRASIESAVLLKNENILPLDKNKTYLVIGDMFKNPRFQGNGSSLINPFKVVTHEEAFNLRKIKYKFYKGYSQIDNEEVNEDELIINDLKTNKYDAILFYGGQTDFTESEGFDRDSLDLPIKQIELIKKLKEINDNIVFISFNGGVINLNFKDDVKGLLLMHLGGEGVGEATTSLLFGEVSPSGKLTETYISKYSDVPFFDEYKKKVVQYYKESIFVGYRYYNTLNIKVNYPFGYGLTYTKFHYSNLKVNLNNETNEIEVSYDISNIGKMDAKEISEIYISKINSNTYRPSLELVGFSKDLIKVNETKSIKVNIPIDNLKIYDKDQSKFILEDGEYEILLGENSRSILLKSSLTLKGDVINLVKNPLNLHYFNLNSLNEITDEEYAKEFSLAYKDDSYIYKYPYNLNTPIFAFNKGFGKFFKNFVVNYFTFKTKKALKIKDPIKRQMGLKGVFFIIKLMPANSLRSLCFSSGGMLKYNVALALLSFCNRKYFKGIKYLFIKEENIN